MQTKWVHGCQSESASPLSPGHMCRTDLASSRAARLASGRDLASLRELEAFHVRHMFLAAVQRWEMGFLRLLEDPLVLSS